jgi:hypothetical protein
MERERVRKREREICRICPELLFLFLKGMMEALAPFSYLVANDFKSNLFLANVQNFTTIYKHIYI